MPVTVRFTYDVQRSISDVRKHLSDFLVRKLEPGSPEETAYAMSGIDPTQLPKPKEVSADIFLLQFETKDAISRNTYMLTSTGPKSTRIESETVVDFPNMPAWAVKFTQRANDSIPAAILAKGLERFQKQFEKFIDEHELSTAEKTLG